MITRTATVADSAPCLVCEHENDLEATLCANCLAPMALSPDVTGHEREPSIISVMGHSNVGKTVYLGFLLDMLSKRAGDFQAIPKGAYSVNLQETVIRHLQRRLFPPKTPCEVDRWHWAHYQIARRGKRTRWYDLVMPDMAGEALAAEVETPKTHTVIRNLLAKTAGCLVLIDAAVTLSSPQPDLFGLKLMSYLDEMLAPRRGRQIPNPVAVVLCKADYCPQCFDDPRLFARANLNRLWNICESRFAQVEFFASSVIGSLGFDSDDQGNGRAIPLHAAPRGILEPLEWMLERLG